MKKEELKYTKKHIPLFTESVERLNEIKKEYGYSQFVPFFRFIVQKFISDHDKSKCDGKQG